MCVCVCVCVCYELAVLLCTRGRSRGMVSSAGSASTLHWATSADDTADSTWGGGGGGGGSIHVGVAMATLLLLFLGGEFSAHMRYRCIQCTATVIIIL